MKFEETRRVQVYNKDGQRLGQIVKAGLQYAFDPDRCWTFFAQTLTEIADKIKEMNDETISR
jgi:hypothetical protein